MQTRAQKNLIPSTHNCVVPGCTNHCYSRGRATFYMDDGSEPFHWKDHLICGNNSGYSREFWDTKGLFCLSHGDDNWGWICPSHCIVNAEEERAYCPVCEKGK